MTVILVIISLYGGIVSLPMKSFEACTIAAAEINVKTTFDRGPARAYCIRNSLYAPNP